VLPASASRRILWWAARPSVSGVEERRLNPGVSPGCCPLSFTGTWAAFILCVAVFHPCSSPVIPRMCGVFNGVHSLVAARLSLRSVLGRGSIAS
jgi:hypothetical protein